MEWVQKWIGKSTSFEEERKKERKKIPFPLLMDLLKSTGRVICSTETEGEKEQPKGTKNIVSLRLSFFVFSMNKLV